MSKLLKLETANDTYRERLLISRYFLFPSDFHLTIQNAISYAKKVNKPVHFIGLLSDGGVHAHIEHMIAVLSLFPAHKRDSAPQLSQYSCTLKWSIRPTL